MPKLSIIIVNYYQLDNLQQLIPQLAHQLAGINWELIVVDNGSGELNEELPWIKQNQTQLIINQKNIGFARACNQGFKKAHGEYLLLLNSDCFPMERAIQRQLNFMRKHSRCAVSGMALLDPQKTPQRFSYGALPTLPYLVLRKLKWMIVKRDMHNWLPCTIHPTGWVSGAAMMIRRSTLFSSQLFSNFFFMYFEDVELCLRLKRQGWQIFFLPHIQAVHRQNTSSKTFTKKLNYYHTSLITYIWRRIF